MPNLTPLSKLIAKGAAKAAEEEAPKVGAKTVKPLLLEAGKDASGPAATSAAAGVSLSEKEVAQLFEMPTSAPLMTPKPGGKALQNLTKGGVLGAAALPAMTGEGGQPATSTKEEVPAGGAASVSVKEASKSEEKKATPAKAPKPVGYKVEDLKAIAREVDKTPIAYSISPEEQKAFDQQRSAINTKMQETIASYNKDVADAKDAKARKETIAMYAEAFERLGLALTTFFAAKRGAEIGQDVSSGVRNIKGTDWLRMSERQLAEYDSARAEAKDRFKIQEGVLKEEGDLLSKKEDTARANAFTLGRDEARRREDIISDNTKAAQRAAELNVKEKNEAAKFKSEASNRAQEKEADRASALENLLTKAAAKAEETQTKVSARSGVDEAKQQKERAVLESKVRGAVAALQTKASPQTKKDFVTFASQLGISPEDQELIIKEATGEGLFNLAEPKVVEQTLGKYQQGVVTPSAPAAATSASAGKIMVRGPKGDFRIPKEQLEIYRANGYNPIE